jgi:photosystem I subunit 10
VSSSFLVKLHLKLSDFIRRNLLFTTTLLAVVPHTIEWGPKVAIVMILCNIVAIAFGKLTIKQPSAAPAMPSSNLFGGFGLPAVIGTACFGHILGAGVILGLSSMGAL